MTGPTGFEAVAGSIGGLQQQAQGLRAAVDSGKLVMDPETAEKLAKLYENKADKLAFKIGDAERLIVRGAFGDCNIGRQLEAKFVAKVEDGENGVIAILRKAQDILKGMAQAYRDSAREMTNTDEEHARNLNRNT